MTYIYRVILFLGTANLFCMEDANHIPSLKEITAKYLASQPLSAESVQKVANYKEDLVSIIHRDMDVCYDTSKPEYKTLPRLTRDSEKNLDALGWLDDSTLAYALQGEVGLKKCHIWDLQTDKQYVYPIDIRDLKKRSLVLDADENNEKFYVKFQGDDQPIAQYNQKEIKQWLVQTFRMSVYAQVHTIVPCGNNPYVIWETPVFCAESKFDIAQFPYAESKELGAACSLIASFDAGDSPNNFFLYYFDTKGCASICDFSTGKPVRINLSHAGPNSASKNGTLVAGIHTCSNQIHVTSNLNAPIPPALFDELLAAKNKKEALARIIFKSQGIDMAKFQINSASPD